MYADMLTENCRRYMSKAKTDFYGGNKLKIIPRPMHPLKTQEKVDASYLQLEYTSGSPSHAFG